MPKRKFSLKRLAMKPVKAVVNRIDMVGILEKLSKYEPGHSFVYKRENASQPAFPDQEEIIRHAIELTKADMLDRGEKTTLKEIEDYARSISCRYDYDLHSMIKAGVFNAIAHLFDHQDYNRLFISEDRRELRHIEKLFKARAEGTGVVYLVNHSSHFDEFVLDLLLEQLGIQLPLFAAGSNMMATPSLERVLMTGSYVIIRRGATKTYLSTLFNYCRALPEMGKQQGIFLEAWAGGARTRDGSLRYPRRLVSLQGALASDKDLLVQPVAVSYNIVPEDMDLAERAGSLSWVAGMKLTSNLLRRPHQPLKAAVASLKDIFSRAYITFGEPRMLSELKEMRDKDPTDSNLDEFVALYSIKEIAKDKKVMASQLTARGIVRARREGTPNLVNAVRAELEDMTEYHRRTFGRDPDLEDFIHQFGLEAAVKDGLKALEQRKVIAYADFKDVKEAVQSENGLQYYATHGDRRLYSPSAKENIVVVGAGAWGYGLSCLVGQRALADKRYLNSSLILFDPREDLVREIMDTRTHPAHFPGLRLPKNVFPTSDATAAFRKANEVLIGSPVDFFETELRRVLSEAALPINVIIATRGFEQISHRLPIQIAREAVEDLDRSDVSLLVLSGPVTAGRLANAAGGSLVLAGPRDAAQRLADLFDLPRFSVFVSDDPMGVQLAAVLSEVYSLLGSYLVRTKEMVGREEIADFLRETSAEAIRLAMAMGGRRETFIPDNPAWTAEYVASGLGGPAAIFGRAAGRSIRSAKTEARETLQQPSREIREEGQHLIGYTGIRSAYLVAKELQVEMPRLRQAYRLFWMD